MHSLLTSSFDLWAGSGRIRTLCFAAVDSWQRQTCSIAVLLSHLHARCSSVCKKVVCLFLFQVPSLPGCDPPGSRQEHSTISCKRFPINCDLGCILISHLEIEFGTAQALGLETWSPCTWRWVHTCLGSSWSEFRCSLNSGPVWAHSETALIIIYTLYHF